MSGLNHLGTSVGGYELEVLLGENGVTAIYVVRKSDELFVLKAGLIPAAREILTHERRVLRTISHPNIIRLVDEVEFLGLPAMVLERFTGGCLFDLIEDERLAQKDMGKIISGLQAACSELHSKGLFHRDIKPENIVVSDEGEPILIDFGAAAIAGEPVESLAGSVGYIAPEHRVGGADPGPATDLYSLGVVLHEMIYSRLPESISNPELQDILRSGAVLEISLPEEPQIPAQWRDKLQRWLQPVPANRFKRQPTPALSAEREVAQPQSNPPVVRKKPRIPRIPWVFVIPVLVLLGVFSPYDDMGSGFLRQLEPSPEHSSVHLVELSAELAGDPEKLIKLVDSMASRGASAVVLSFTFSEEHARHPDLIPSLDRIHRKGCQIIWPSVSAGRISDVLPLSMADVSSPGESLRHVPVTRQEIWHAAVFAWSAVMDLDDEERSANVRHLQHENRLFLPSHVIPPSPVDSAVKGSAVILAVRHAKSFMTPAGEQSGGASLAGLVNAMISGKLPRPLPPFAEAFFCFVIGLAIVSARSFIFALVFGAAVFGIVCLSLPFFMYITPIASLISALVLCLFLVLAFPQNSGYSQTK